MTDRNTAGQTIQGSAGFTLVEMMVALGVLLFGVTSLIGAMIIGVDTRRSAEQQHRAVQIVGAIVHELQQGILATPPAQEEDAARPALADVEWTTVPGHPGLKVRIRFVTDPAIPELVLARISVLWQEQGETQSEVFERILKRQEPYPRRVSRIRDAVAR